jgi:uncharacterized membrane protein
LSAVTTPRAGRREWIGLAVIALPCLLYSMDLTVLFLAVPHLSAALRPSSAELLWITDIYGFLLAGLLITMGTLGDRIGRRRLLLLGAAMFGLASLLAAYSTSPGMLIAARALLGVAGATLAVAGVFQPARRRVQAAVDRRFNRRRYDAARTIAAFSTRLREEVDLDTLTAELLAVVEQTMQPTQASLWLRASVSAAQDPGSTGTSGAAWQPTAASQTLRKAL